MVCINFSWESPCGIIKVMSLISATKRDADPNSEVNFHFKTVTKKEKEDITKILNEEQTAPLNSWRLS